MPDISPLSITLPRCTRRPPVVARGHGGTARRAARVWRSGRARLPLPIKRVVPTYFLPAFYDGWFAGLHFWHAATGRHRAFWPGVCVDGARPDCSSSKVLRGDAVIYPFKTRNALHPHTPRETLTLYGTRSHRQPAIPCLERLDKPTPVRSR